MRVIACSCLNLNFVRPRDASEDGSGVKDEGPGVPDLARAVDYSALNVRKP